jgi:hypothetical protein
MTPRPEDEFGPVDGELPRHEVEFIRKRQRERARLTAILLGLFVVLMFAITIAKMTVNQ